MGEVVKAPKFLNLDKLPGGKEEVASLGVNQDGQQPDAVLELVRWIYKTPPEKLAEMTNIPLGMVQTVVMMACSIIEAEELCKDMKENQKRYNEIWKKYHPDDEVVDVENDPDYDIDALSFLPESWLYLFFQVRRSIRGDHVMGAVTLAQEQIQAKAPEPEDLASKLRDG